MVLHPPTTEGQDDNTPQPPPTHNTAGEETRLIISLQKKTVKVTAEKIICRIDPGLYAFSGVYTQHDSPVHTTPSTPPTQIRRQQPPPPQCHFDQAMTPSQHSLPPASLPSPNASSPFLCSFPLLPSSPPPFSWLGCAWVVGGGGEWGAGDLGRVVRAGDQQNAVPTQQRHGTHQSTVVGSLYALLWGDLVIPHSSHSCGGMQTHNHMLRYGMPNHTTRPEESYTFPFISSTPLPFPSPLVVVLLP